MLDFKRPSETSFWLKAGGALLACLVLVSILTDFFNGLQLPEPVNLYCTLRARTFFASFDRVIAKPDPLVFLFGSSEVEGYLDPRLIDAATAKAGQSTDSYNLGLRALHPSFFRAFAMRFADEMRGHHRRAAFAFVHIPRVRLTKHYRRFSPVEANQEFLFSITPWPNLAAQAGFDIPELLTVGLKKILFRNGYVSPLQAWLDGRRISKRMEVNAEFAGYFRLWKENKFMEYPAWSFDHKGLYGFNAVNYPEDYARAVAQMSDPQSRDWSVSYFQKCCDLLGEHFDTSLVQEFADGLKALGKVTDHIIIYDLYEADDIENLRQPGANRRVAELMQFLAQQTGAEFRDIAAGLGADPANFLDFEHPSKQGVLLLTDRITQVIVETNAKHP